MEANKTLFAVIKPESEKEKIIIKNVLKMLSNRIYIDNQGQKHQLLNETDAMKKVSNRGENTYIIKTDNHDTYVVKIVFQKISSTGKQSIISDFLKDYEKNKKIIVAQDFNNKIADFMSKQQTQIFKENALMSDLISYRDQPEFELLTPNEMELFKKEYNATDYTTKKMLKNDAVAKYFALKKGDIIRIIRPSPTSGQAIDYRIVM